MTNPEPVTSAYQDYTDKPYFIDFFHMHGYRIGENPDQLSYVKALLDPKVKVVFCNSESGTGKTSLATLAGLFLLNDNVVEKIRYVRSPIEVGEGLGYLPGSVEEKERQYFQPIIDTCERITEGKAGELVANKQLEMMTTAYIRGRDWYEPSFNIIDEAQNLDLNELMTTMTRHHDNGKLVVIGSSLQVDNKKMKRYGSAKLTPFEVAIRHFMSPDKPEEVTGIVASNHVLTTNYRGKVAKWADQLRTTADSID